MTSIIQPLRPDDMGVFTQLVRDLAAHDGMEDQVTADVKSLRSILFGDEPKAFSNVLEVDGEIIGYVTWYVTFASWFAKYGIWMCEIYVKPEHRGQGHGKALVEHLRTIAQERGYHGIGWWSERVNLDAHGFYRHMGAMSAPTRLPFYLPVVASAVGVDARLAELNDGWRIDGDRLECDFEFASFMNAVTFVDAVAKIAEVENHHPDIDLRYRKVHVSLTTHSAGGLTDLDFKVAYEIDSI